MTTPLLDEDKILQICFVTDDLEKSMAWFSNLTGKAVSHIGKAAEPAEAQASYRGRPAAIGCRLAIFKFGNIDVEFLEPGPEKSAWRELLDDRGPGCHHIAFRTYDLKSTHDYLTEQGHEMIQRGEFNGGGGRYAYYDTTDDLGVLVELLEDDSLQRPQS